MSTTTYEQHQDARQQRRDQRELMRQQQLQEERQALEQRREERAQRDQLRKSKQQQQQQEPRQQQPEIPAQQNNRTAESGAAPLQPAMIFSTARLGRAVASEEELLDALCERLATKPPAVLLRNRVQLSSMANPAWSESLASFRSAYTRVARHRRYRAREATPLDETIRNKICFVTAQAII